MGGAATLTPLLWFDASPRPGWQQMAIDRALAARAATDGTVVYRLYRWRGHSVSFGANEAAQRTWDRGALERAQLPCVRRPTGGRGVWHDAEDLTYAVTGPVVALGGLRLAYRLIHEQLAGALRQIGLDASVAPDQRRVATLTPGACFDAAVGGEVLVAGRKTIGSAQAVFGPAMLQHGAIARASRHDALARFRLGSPASTGERRGDELPAADLLADAIVATWISAGVAPVTAGLVDWAESASAAHGARYQDPDWTWRR